jgi:flagellar basal-body rod protein FlgF
MGGLIETGSELISAAQRRVAVAGQNIANATTTGYKRSISFETVLRQESSSQATSSRLLETIDARPGSVSVSGRETDLAIEGTGYFVLARGNEIAYARAGQFERDAAGRWVTASGFALQYVGGGDVTVPEGKVTVARDGAVRQGSDTLGRLMIAIAEDGAAMSRVEGGFRPVGNGRMVEVATPMVRQGALEASNVSVGEEMVAMIAALRRAESGQRLIGVYDDLMGRATTAFGEAVR